MPTQIQLEQLAKSLEGSLLFDELHKTIYSTDASVYKMCPIAVAIPKTEQDIVILIQFAKNHKISLTPRTAGTYLAITMLITVMVAILRLGFAAFSRSTRLAQPMARSGCMPCPAFLASCSTR